MSKHKKSNPNDPKKIFDPNAVKEDPFADEADEQTKDLQHRGQKGEPYRVKEKGLKRGDN